MHLATLASIVFEMVQNLQPRIWNVEIRNSNAKWYPIYALLMALGNYYPTTNRTHKNSASYRVYISQLIRFARASSHVSEFNCPNHHTP